MAFAVPASKASIKQNRFEFTLPGDRTTKYSMPKLQYLKPSVLSLLDGKDKTDVVVGLLEEYAPGVLGQLESMEQLTALYEAWAEASGISVGESSASTDS